LNKAKGSGVRPNERNELLQFETHLTLLLSSYLNCLGSVLV
jgi:hypothetical protein